MAKNNKQSQNLNASKILADSADEMINNDSVGLSTSTTDDEEFERLLNDFINNEIKDIEIEPEVKVEEAKELVQTNKPAPATITSEDTLIASLFEEERALISAYNNFMNAMEMMSQSSGLPLPSAQVSPELLYPRYKPREADKFMNDAINGWNLMLQIYNDNLENLNPGASDDDILNFAEKTTDNVLQLALISYVEILIEIESCEIAYESRRIRAKKKRIERQIIEEHAARQQKIKQFIQRVEEKNFPINAERLVVNYFKTARKDPDGAYKILTNNPATYAPIEVNKIPNRLFGLIKSKPEDGIKINKEIANFMKKLKA